MLGSLTWYVTRASGVVAYALLAGGTLWGLMLSTRITRGRAPRPWMLDVHRMLGGVAVALVGVHVVAILLDSFVKFDVASVLIPFASKWNPGAVAAGVVAMYMLAAVEITSLLKQRIRQRTWRRVHYLSFVLFILASIHFIAAGTDATSALAKGLIVLAVVTVVGLTGYRIARAVSTPVVDETPARSGARPVPSPRSSASKPAAPRPRPVTWTSDDGRPASAPPRRRTDRELVTRDTSR